MQAAHSSSSFVGFAGAEVVRELRPALPVPVPELALVPELVAAGRLAT
jgi:hypothetical protein